MTKSNENVRPIEKNKLSHVVIGVLLGIGFFFSTFLPFGDEIFCCIPASIIAGLFTGFITGRFAKIENRDAASRIGSNTGAIVGLSILFGQILNGIITITMFRYANNIPGGGITPPDLPHQISMFLIPRLINGIIGLFVTPFFSSIASVRSFD